MQLPALLIFFINYHTTAGLLPVPLEHRTFTKAVEFEQIWIAKNVNGNYHATDVLNDDEYLDYKLWDDMNTEILYKKHRPNTLLIRGKNPNIIFHGRCLGCLSQRLHGLERCKDECRRFESSAR